MTSSEHSEKQSGFGGENILIYLLFLASLGIRFALAIFIQPFYDDAFITFRYAANLASGTGFVFNAGERILGTSTPLFAVLLSLGHKLLFLPIPQLALLIGFASFTATYFILNRILIDYGFSLHQRLWVLLPFSLIPSLVLSSETGMESAFLLFLMLWALRLAQKGSGYAVGLVCGLLWLTRFDSLPWIFIVVFSATWMRDRKTAFKLLATFTAIVGCWIIFANHYWGSAVPHTAIAKMLVQKDTSSLGHRTLEGFDYYLKFRHGIFALPFALPFLVGLYNSLRSRNFLGIAVGIFFFAYVMSFAIAGAVIYPWYLVPGFFAFSVLAGIGFHALAETLARHVRFLDTPNFSRIGLAACAVCLIAWIHADARYNWSVLKDPPSREVGYWLGSNAKPTDRVFAEPAGLIGFYCRCKFMDSIGLVSDEALDFWKKPGGRSQWFPTAVKEIRPEYIVFRQYEIDRNLLYPKNTSLFSVAEREWFDQNYQRVFVADSHSAIKKADEFYVYKKLDIVAR